MKTEIVKTAVSSKRMRKEPELVNQSVHLDKGDKVSFHPYRQKKLLRGVIISSKPNVYENKRTKEKMELVTIRTVKGEVFTKTKSSLKLIKKMA